MATLDAARALARKLPPAQRTVDLGGNLRLRQGVVDDIAADETLDVILNGDAVVLTGLRYIGRLPAVAATVWVLHQPPAPPIVLGPLGSDGPRGVLGSAQATADQGSITSEVDLTSLSVAVVVGLNRYIIITGYGVVGGSASGDRAIMRVKESTTTLTSAAEMVGVSNVATSSMTLQPRARVIDPTPGAHTYKLTLQRATGAGTVQLNAAATTAYIEIEDKGPSP